MDKQKANAYLPGIAMSVIVGLQYIFLKGVIERFNGRILLLLAVRFAIASIPLLFLLKDFRMRDALKPRVLVVCLFQPCLNLLAQTYAAQYASVTAIACLTALAPLMTAVSGRLVLREKKSPPLFYAFMGAVVCGSIMAISANPPRQSSSWAGIALCAASVVFRSIYSPLSKKATMKISPLNLAIAQVFVGTAFYAALAFASGEAAFLRQTFSALRPFDHFSLFYLSILSIALCYILNNILLEKLSVSMSGMLNNLTFVSTLLSGVLFLSEPISWLAAGGSALICVGMYASALAKSKGKAS
jgi:drug/metabolite transporter (DMT)-like permease